MSFVESKKEMNGSLQLVGAAALIRPLLSAR
jgi:hypothetical protein